MKTETLIWLLPVVFMLHDFEEIIMIRPWLARNQAALEGRFPPRVIRLMHTTGDLSPSAFALAVAGEFILISLLTALSAEFGWYALWAGLLGAFFIHLLLHIGQYIIFRAYVPVILTSLPAAGYCIYAVSRLAPLGLFAWGEAALWTGIGLLVVVGEMALLIRLASRFDRWLTGVYAVH